VAWPPLQQAKQCQRNTHNRENTTRVFSRVVALNVDLLLRIKQINKVRLYRPAAGRRRPGGLPAARPGADPAVRWDLIADNYDQVIRYATAIGEGTASTEAVLSRFTRSATHPAYQAMLEIGRAQRTIFVARYLRDRDLQRGIEEGLNVVEA
jgi:TnpA family transposase